MDKTICAIVEYEYAAKEPDELDLHKGAIINRIKQMPGGWWQGTLKANGVTGMFPDNFVRILEPSNGSNGNHSDDSAAVQLREKSATSNRRCKVIYSYTQVNDDELTLAVGDVIEFLGEVEEGWWRGRLRSKVGVFPSNFVQHIEPSPILASKRPPTIGATVATAPLTAKAANIIATTATTTPAPATAAPAAATAAPATTTTKQTRSRGTASIVDTTTTATAAVAAAAPTLPPKPQRDFCRVEFPYAPQNEDELELKVDDIISVISMELADKGWWKGELRGKVGVFPDNFVKLLAPSEVAPINEPSAATTQQSQRKISNSSHMTTTNANNSSSSSNTTTTTVTQQQQQQQQQQQSSASTTSKVYIKKTGSSSNSSSSGRKESFGSRDSLNDILSETGLPIGTVAAQRKSLENKNLDLSKLPGGKQQGSTIITTATSSNSSSTTNSSSSSSNVVTSAYAELRKSLDSMDEKMKSPPPPVLSKKPSVPLKKTPTGSGPANILGGAGIKKKSADGKLTSAVSHDVSDGMAGSKLNSGQLPESGIAGNVVMRRAATIAGEDTDFDRVERGSILQDMRAGRVKAPKRRPPSTAINVLGESNNNSVYVNGSGMASSTSELSEDGGVGKQATASSDDNSTGEEPQLAKPKPREWEKKTAPWMAELKASQVTRKKTSPSVEPRGGAIAGTERTSKLFAAEQATATSSVLTTSATSSTSNTISSNTTATKVQSSAVTSSSIMQQSMIVESSNSSSSSSSQKKESTSSSSSTSIVTSNNNHNDAIMSKSLSATKATGSIAPAAVAAAAVSSDEESRASRPKTLSIRNRSVSPLVKLEKSNNVSVNDSPATTLQNNHQAAATTSAATAPDSTPRVQQLEGRVDKLEAMVLVQQRTIEELVRSLREETECVKVLRGELDKYAQCVTQV